jgi:hypothetical protein
MSSTFKGLSLFSSGPHRFSVGTTGSDLLPNWRIIPQTPGTTVIGPLEVGVVVRGVLVAGSEAGLWALRDALQAQVTHPPQVGTLVDQNGRSWADMTLVRLESADRTDRGRQWSIGYSASFVRLIPLP